MTKPAKTIAVQTATVEDWLPTQRVLRAFREAGNSLGALGKAAGVDSSMLSRATTIAGRELDNDTLRRLFPHVEGLREAASQQIAEKLVIDAADLGIDLPTGQSASAGTMLSHSQIHQSLRLNPRKRFDEAALAELAESIAERGLLQNITVRRSEDGRYEIVAGERRWRAIQHLIDQKRWDAEAANIPVKIISVEEAEARSIALLENLQRVEITPLEEAVALAELQELDPDVWTTQAIARSIGKDNESGHRYVLQRLSLVYRLNDSAREALANDLITFEKARFLTQLTPAAQDQVITELERGDVDLTGLYDAFRARAQAIADALSPKDQKPSKPKPAAKDRNAGPTGQQESQAYRGIIAAAPNQPPQDGMLQDVTDIDPADLVGLPDPTTWGLKTHTAALLTITLQAPSQEAFEAACRLFQQNGPLAGTTKAA